MQEQTIEYRDGDTRLRGELYRPQTPNGRSILLVHEADGIGGNVRRRCAMLADLGYAAFAADLYGKGRPLDGEEVPQAVAAFRSDSDAFRRRTHAGLEALAAASGSPPARIAAIGYCFGGMAVLELARSGAPIAAAVSYHGLLRTTAPAQAGAVKARIAVFSGGCDPLVPWEDVTAFQQEMDSAGADWQLSIYGQAWHSFTNIGVRDLDDPRMRYDPVADAQSWQAGLAFIAHALDIS